MMRTRPLLELPQRCTICQK